MSDKAWFVHIPKCGGMTVRRTRSSRIICVGKKRHFASPEYVKLYKEAFPEEKLNVIHHCRLIDLKDSIRDKKIFTAVRNPWDRVASRYFYALQFKDKCDFYNAITGFQSFLDTYHKHKERPFYWHRAIKGWYPAAHYVCDERGELGAHCVRTENLVQDVLDLTGVKLGPWRNRTKERLRYQSLYSEKQIQFVADIYARDIELWGFDFDTPATRNIAV